MCYIVVGHPQWVSTSKDSVGVARRGQCSCCFISCCFHGRSFCSRGIGFAKCSSFGTRGNLSIQWVRGLSRKQGEIISFNTYQQYTMFGFFLCVSTVQHHLSSLRACLCMLEMRSWADPLSSLPDSNRPKGAAQLADLSTGDVNNVFLLFTLFHDHVICHQWC